MRGLTSFPLLYSLIVDPFLQFVMCMLYGIYPFLSHDQPHKHTHKLLFLIWVPTDISSPVHLDSLASTHFDLQVLYQSH